MYLSGEGAEKNRDIILWGVMAILNDPHGLIFTIV